MKYPSPLSIIGYENLIPPFSTLLRITGPPGVGKSTLAATIPHSFSIDCRLVQDYDDFVSQLTEKVQIAGETDLFKCISYHQRLTNPLVLLVTHLNL